MTTSEPAPHSANAQKVSRDLDALSVALRTERQHCARLRKILIFVVALDVLGGAALLVTQSMRQFTFFSP